MKLSTHVIFSVGLVFFTSVKLFSSDLPTATVLAIFSLVMQYSIDALSHEKIGGYSRRTPLLHSPTGAFAISVVFTLAFFAIFRKIHMLPLAMVANMIAAFSHLLLDSITERGIYLGGRRIVEKRMLSSSNPFLNVGFSLVGFSFLILSVM